MVIRKKACKANTRITIALALEEDDIVEERERGSPHRAVAKEEALASGNLSEDDPVKMRAKKLKSDDGNGERRNATGGAEGVKYAATTARERALEKSRGRWKGGGGGGG